MKKYLTAIFPIILCTVPAYSARWTGYGVSAKDIYDVCKKYASDEEHLFSMLEKVDHNVQTGQLNVKNFVDLCKTGGFNNYKKCEGFVIDMKNLAKKAKGSGTKASDAAVAMGKCEADVRNNLKEKSQAAIRDALVKQCQFTDISTYDKITVSAKHATALTGLVNQKNCRVDNVYNLLICQNKYMYAFGGLNGSGKVVDANYRNNIAKAVCNASASNPDNRDIMSFDDNIKGCPTPQVVKTCNDYQKLLQKVDSSLIAKEHKEYAQVYCTVDAKAKVERIDFEEGAEIIVGGNKSCTPQQINTSVFANASVMPMQAIAMANRYLAKQCHNYQCGDWPSGSVVKCGDYEFKFNSINNSNQGQTANHSISKAFCEIYGGSYSNMTDNYGLCGVSSSVCSGALRGDVQTIVNNSIAVSYEAGQCVLSWGPRPNWSNIDNSAIGGGEYFDPDSWMSRPEDPNNMQSVMKIEDAKNGRLADQPVSKPKKSPKSSAPVKSAKTPDTEYKPDGVTMLASGSIIPVNEFVDQWNSVNRAKQVLKEKTGENYDCGTATKKGTEVLCQHPTQKDVYVKVQFAGFTESSPKTQTSAPTTPVVNKNTGNADYAVCAKTAMEGVANNSCRNRVEQLVRYNQQRGAISEARYGSRHTECSSDGRCVVNIPVKMADGSEKYAFACCKLSVPSSFDVCEVSSNRVLFKTSEGSSTSVKKVDISNRRIAPGDC